MPKLKFDKVPPLDLDQLARDAYRRGLANPSNTYWDPSRGGWISNIEVPKDYQTYTKLSFNSIHGLYNLCRAEFANLTPQTESGIENLDNLIIHLMSLNLKRPLTSIETKTVALRSRLELFNRIPSCANMILAFKLIEDIILETYKSSISDIDTRSVEKFDKLKNLALSTKYIHERKLAFTKSLEIFVKLTKVEGLI